MKRKILLLLGPFLFLLCTMFLPNFLFGTTEMKAAVGTAVWMIFWWITAPVEYVITAFLPIAVNALIPMVDMSDVTGNYASETVLLLLGASVLTSSWEKSGLDQQIAVCFFECLETA